MLSDTQLPAQAAQDRRAGERLASRVNSRKYSTSDDWPVMINPLLAKSCRRRRGQPGWTGIPQSLAGPRSPQEPCSLAVRGLVGGHAAPSKSSYTQGTIG